jgi:hypothetical protein
MGILTTPDMAVDDLYELSGMKKEANLNGEEDGNGPEFYLPFNFGASFLDIEENIGNITSLENRITDLFYLADDIQNASGMNQSFAMEAEKLLPGFGGVPIGYYTVDTSATRYKVAVEELSAGIWALIAAAITAVAAMIYKFIKYVFGKDSEKGKLPTVDDIEDIKKKTDEHAEIVSDVNSVLKNDKNL